MSKDSHTGKDFVYAILAYLNERQEECVTFKPSTYGNESDIPFCKKLNGCIDTVRPSSDKPGSIILTVVRTDAAGRDYAASETFNGSEDEDFDYLFHEVYYYICDANAPEAQEWMENNVMDQPCRDDFEKEFLIMKIRQSVKRIGKAITIPCGYSSKPYPGDDTEVLMNVLTLNTEIIPRRPLVAMTDVQGTFVCTMLDYFSVEDLKANYQYLLATEINHYHEYDDTCEETKDDRAFIAYLEDEKERLESIIRGPKWDFVYEEQFPDSNGTNLIGIIQNKNNPKQVLFFQVYAEDKDDIETCHIFSSITLDAATQVCEYPWTAENDQMLLNCLNNQCVGNDYTCDDGPISILPFENITGTEMVY